MTFKDDVAAALLIEINADVFVTETILKLKNAIMASIASPGIERWVIVPIMPSDIITSQVEDPDQPGQFISVTETTSHPISDNQITRLKMGCKLHVCIPVEITPLEMIVDMNNFLL